MQKQTPTFGKILVMVLFALSCFGLLLFLWLSFGGSVPLKPKGYRFKIDFPEATQLGQYADVRTAGVSVGKVRSKDLAPHGNRTEITVELDRKFAPLHADAKAILRQKTLLGETYVELTPGTKNAPLVPENGTLHNGQVRNTTELDEIFQAFDPKTRQYFRDWQQEIAKAVDGRGQDLNDAIGNLPAFAHDTTDVLDVLNGQSEAVRRLFRNTGVVFNALSESREALHGVIVHSDEVFDATSREQNALAETFKIFPTFLDESRRTAVRLESFSRDARPLVRDLRPAARDLKATLRDVRAFAPDLKNTFVNLDPLITVSKTGLPALRDTLNGTGPLLAQVSPFLGELNPILQWIELYQKTVGDFIYNGAGGLVDGAPLTADAVNRGELGKYLRQIGPSGAESAAMFRSRMEGNRGNAYLSPTALAGRDRAKYNIPPSWVCDNVKTTIPFKRGETPTTDAPGSGHGASCFLETLPGTSGPGKFPRIQAKDYLTSVPPAVRGR
jgi:virulence factor Mce-like protein